MADDKEGTTPQPRVTNDLVYPADSPTLPIVHLQGNQSCGFLKEI